MKKISVSILAALLMLFMVFSTNVLAADEQVEPANVLGVQYKTHIQDKGWETDWKTNGELSGTVGEWKRLEALKIELTGGAPEGAMIQTYVHVQNKGDLGPFSMGTLAGTEGEGLRLESIKLVLNNLPGYTIKYNVQVENKGWLKDVNDSSKWFVSGEKAGTAGEGLRLEGIKIILVQTSDLTSYNEVIALVKEADHTTASWAAYQTVVAANAVTMTNSQIEINAAAVKITEAQKSLVKVANMTYYDAAISAVTEDQAKSGWVAYKAVLAANVVTKESTQAEVDVAVVKILAAQKNLVLYGDMIAFNKAIALYVEYGADAANAPYTTATWDAYAAQCELYGTLTDGVWVYDVVSRNNTQATVDAATTYINSAVVKLVKSADLTEFNAIKGVAVTDGPYTTASFIAYTSDARVTAITSLTMDALKGSSQGVVDGYTNTLFALQNEILVTGSDISGYKTAIAKVTQAHYTTVSWATYQAVVAANVVTSNNNQTVVDAATAKVLEAQGFLIYSSAYVVEHAQINSPSFEVQSVDDNIITRAKELMTANGLDVSKYLVTFTRVDGGSAVINPTTGFITNIGTGTATVTFAITPTDGSAAATTANIVLVLI